MNLIATILLFLISLSAAWGQDERVFRDLLAGELAPKTKSPTVENPHFHVTTPFYELDLNRDNRTEYIVIEKKDSEDWLHIHNYNRTRIFSLKFVKKGIESNVYKLNYRKLSDQTNVLLVSYYEGHNQAENFIGRARLYVITIDNGDLKTLKAERGPLMWEEFADSKLHYHQRPYHVSLYDFDSDGVREVAVRHHLVTRVMKYTGNGLWK